MPEIRIPPGKEPRIKQKDGILSVRFVDKDEPSKNLIFDSYNRKGWAWSPRQLASEKEAMKEVVVGGSDWHEFNLYPRRPYAGIQKFRSEISQQKGRIKVGDTVCYEGKFLVRQGDLEWGRSKRLQSVMVHQWHDLSVMWQGKKVYVSPCWALWIEKGGSLRFAVRYGTLGRDGKSARHEESINGLWQYNKSVKYKVELKYHPSNGFVRVWVNDRKVFEWEGGCGIVGSKLAHFKMGMYRPPGDEELLKEFQQLCKQWTVYLSRHKIYKVN